MLAAQQSPRSTAADDACCPVDVHEALKADTATFRAGPVPIGRMPNGTGGYLELGTCLVCTSTLALEFYEVASSTPPHTVVTPALASALGICVRCGEDLVAGATCRDCAVRP